MKNIEFSNEDQLVEGISVGLKKEESKESKILDPKKEEKETQKEPIKKPQKKQDAEKPKKKRVLSEKIRKKKNVRLPVSKEKVNKSQKKNNKKQEEQESPLSIRKIYQSDVYTDDVESLNLSSIYTRSIKNHLNFCYSKVLEGQNKDLEMVEEIEIVFNLTKNGVIKFDFKKNIDEKILKDKKFMNYQEIIEKLNNSTKNCAIFRNLPSDKYEIWQEFKVLFTSKNKNP